MTDLLTKSDPIPSAPAALELEGAVAGDYPDLLVSGWLPVPGPRLERASLVDAYGMLVPTPFQLHVEPLPGGNGVLENPDGGPHRSHFAVLIDAFGVEGPTAVWLELSDGECYSFELARYLSAPMPEDAKRRLLQLFKPAAPKPDGGPEADLAPGLGPVGASPGDGLAAKEPPPDWVDGPAGTGMLEVDWAFTTDDGDLVLEGWLATFKPQIQRVALVDQDGTVASVPFQLNAEQRPDVLQRRALPDGFGCVGYRLRIDASGVTQPRALRLQVEDGGCYSIHLGPHLAVPVPEMQKQFILKAFAPTATPAGAAAADHAKVADLAGAVDLWHRLDDQITGVTGWCWAFDRTTTSVAVRTRGGEVPCRVEELITYQRKDADGPPRLGFMLRFRSAAEPPASLHFQDQLHGAWDLPFPPQPLDHDAWVGHLADQYTNCDRQFEFQPDQRARVDHFFGDLLTAVRTLALKNSQVVEEDRFGAAVTSPAVSLLVLLGKYHVGLTPLQVQKLTADPFVREQDLVFLAQAGPDAAQHRRCLARFHRMYGTRARLLVVGPAVDVGGTVNLGVPAAVAPHLLLLGAQVVPRKPGWLETLLEDCRRDPTAAAVGARLVYFDGSVHHIGIGWQRDPRGGEFPVPTFPLRGLDQQLVPAPGLVEVPAVSLGCLLAPTARFEGLGRLDPYFIGGELVDTDYCLRARQKGHRILCDHRAVLAFADASLEGPVLYPAHQRYNALRFHRRWQQAFPEEINASARFFNLPG